MEKESPGLGVNQRPMAGILFFISGAIGLIYEIVWIKLLSYELGGSAWAISTVISAFMAGLGIGSWWAGRRVGNWQRHFRIYGFIELGIAITGFLSLPILRNIDFVISPLYPLASSHFAWFVVIRLVLIFVLLFIPTALMGASLPVLIVGISRLQTFEGTVGFLYGINTLGAAVGAALTGFFLLPFFGIKTTVGITCTGGFIIGLMAIGWDRARPLISVEKQKETAAPQQKAPWALLLAVFMAGALSIFYEISWTRLLAPILGSSTYAFSVILIVFLIGIGLGGLIASTSIFSRFRYRPLIAILMALNSITVLGGLFFVNYLPDLFLQLARICHQKVWVFFLAQSLIAGSLMLIPTVLMGVSLPLAILGAKIENNEKGKAVGGIYLFNTFGSIAGALLAGFVVLPKLGAPRSIFAACMAGVVAGFFLACSEKNLSHRTKKTWTVATTVCLFLFVFFSPKINLRQLHAGVFRSVLKNKPSEKVPTQPDMIFIREGHNCTVTIYRHPLDTHLKINGKTDATMAGDLPTQYLLGHVPLFLCPKPDSVCVIGLGSGATVRAVAGHPVQRIDVVELESAVVEAEKYFEPINNNILNDPRVHLHLEDGRTFLKFHSGEFDVIISEPSNPWVAGVSALFSREYYKMVRKRLKPEGIYCQWIQLYEMSQETLDVMLQTLADAFPHVSIFVYGGDLICVASAAKIELTPERFAERFSWPDVRATLKKINIENEYDVIIGYLASLPEDRDLFQTEKRNTDDNLWLEYRAPIEMHMGMDPELKTLPSHVFLGRLCERFFSGIPPGQVAVNLARSLVKLRPQAAYRITGLKGATNNADAVSKIAKMESEAMRWAKLMEEQSKVFDTAAQMLEFNNQNKEVIALLLNMEKESLTNPYPFHKLLGIAYSRNREFEEALIHLKKALEINEQDYVTLTELGVVMNHRKEFDKAEKLFNEAIRLNPLYLGARSHLFALLTTIGRNKEALEQRKSSAVKSSPEKFESEIDKILSDSPFSELKSLREPR